MMKCTFCLFISALLFSHLWAQKPLNSSINGHSHNDYAQKHPFKTAFEAHMASIEADVFLINNNLYVAHEAKEINLNYTLESLYLKPIIEAIQAGTVYPMVLLIDIKSQADSTLDVVVQQIARYPLFK
jgi:alkaline phosphatase